MREIVIEETDAAAYEADGWLCRKVAYLGRRNAPDHWYLKAGHWIVVEYKKLGETPNLAQQREHDRLRGHGQKVHVVDSIAAGAAVRAKANAEIAARVARAA